MTPADLPEPTTDAGRVGLAALLAEPGAALLGLDFDGTLAPIVPDPDAARGHPDVPRVLTRLAAAGVRVAVVTGRPGRHRGGVRRHRRRARPGRARALRVGALGGRHRDRARGPVRRRGGAPPAAGRAGGGRRPEGTYVEDKDAAVAVHTRRTADPSATFDALREPLTELAEEVGLVVEPGRFVHELRPAGGDKGDALRTLVAERAPSVVVFAGDDLGDLAAFDAVDRLRVAGTPGLLVCSGSTEVTEPPTGPTSWSTARTGWWRCSRRSRKPWTADRRAP